MNDAICGRVLEYLKRCPAATARVSAIAVHKAFARNATKVAWDVAARAWAEQHELEMTGSAADLVIAFRRKAQ